MTRLHQALIRIATDLRALRLRWALIGGLAVSARAEPRTTRDVDVAIAVRGDREAETAVKGLLTRGYTWGELVLEQKDVDRLATVRLVAPGEPEGAIVVDLLFASSGVEPEVVAAAEPLEVLPGFSVPVATVGHLLALKVLAEHPERSQDLNDARALLAKAGLADVQLARETLELISRRGYDRDKDLQTELARILAMGPARL